MPDTFTILTVCLAASAFFLAGIAFIMATVCFIELRSFQKSTHKIQYVPLDANVDKENEEFISKWATSPEEIKKQEKLYQEDLAKSMPELVSSDVDKEVYSF